MKTILVTGGSGYIGSHTVVELLSNNYNVVIVDNFCNSNRNITDRIKKIIDKPFSIYDKDCRDDLTEIFTNHKIDGVIHFAALKSVGESVSRPIEYYDNNINSLLNILNYCKRFDVNNIVFSSSCSLYGNVDTIPVNELTPISEPESPYAYTKLVGERILRDFSKINENIKVVCLRYFNPVGAHHSGLIGESPINKPNNIIPVICSSLEGGELTIYGDDYDTPDGTCIRDYVHVTDIANAHILSLEYNKNNFEIFNLGSQKGISVMELIRTFEKYNQLKLNYRIGSRRPGDVVKIYSDSSKALSMLGWSTKFTTKDMVTSALNWYKNKI